MRSTMTLYRAGSPMRVPPSFTISAVTPSLAPSFLTRSIKAGGKLYSRPQRRPTVFMFVLLSGTASLFDGRQFTACAEEGRSEEHTSELQSQSNLVCRLLLEKKKKMTMIKSTHIP